MTKTKQKNSGGGKASKSAHVRGSAGPGNAQDPQMGECEQSGLDGARLGIWGRGKNLRGWDPTDLGLCHS